MVWVRTITEEQATGTLSALYRASIERAGRVFNIVKAQSLRPRSLRAGLALYRETTLAASPLSRALREMVAVVVSRANACHY